MPLPDAEASRQPWPPKAFAKLYETLTEHDAWYSGDPDKLTNFYGRDTSSPRPSDNTPRLWRRARQFWGRQKDTPEGRYRLHVPAPADIATTSADLLFSEPPEIIVSGAHDTSPDSDAKAAQDRLDTIIEEDGLFSVFTESAEIAAALSGVYLRVTWDRDVVPDWPLLTAMHPDQAVPEFAYGRHLTAVTFWREVAHEHFKVLRHLERHEPGRILHGLYEGNDRELGTLIPLTAHEATAGLAESLTPLADGGDGQAIETGIDDLTVVYVPNMRPSRRFRLSAYGRSDYEGVEGLFDALDETYTSWMRDIRLGKARIIVSQGALTNMGKGHGATFDADQEVFTEVNFPPSSEKGAAANLTENQFKIRTEEHAETAAALFERIVTTAGYSGRTFGIHTEGGGAPTATEVHASERRSFITRGKKAGYWQPGLARALELLLAVDQAQGFQGAVVPVRPQVTLADSVQENPETTARTMELLRRAEAASTDTLVRMTHPEWEDEQVAAEVSRILDESGRAVPDPMQAGDLV